MAFTTLADLTQRGHARHATVVFGDRSVRFDDLGVWLDADQGLAHLLDAEMKQHLATVPINTVFVEWLDLAPIQHPAHITP